MKKYVYIFLFATILIGSISALIVVFYPSDVTINTMQITSDEELEQLKLPGTGERYDPYIIENIDFGVFITNVSDYITLLSITNTTKHILIRNNNFIGGFIGIYIDSIEEGSVTIKDNYFEYRQQCIEGFCFGSYYAMLIYNSSSINIVENSFKESNYEGYIYGIFFEKGYNINISKNSISSFYGIYGLNSYSFIIDNNTYFETVDNYFEQCSYFTISRNYHDYLFRFKMVTSSNAQIYENTIIGYNNSFGFFVYSSYNITIYSNTFYENIVGIRVRESSFSVIRNNIFNRSSAYAIEIIDNSNYIQVYQNHFRFNNLNAIVPIQAYDSGFSNTWFDSTNLIGNYWTNLGTNSTYTIDGPASSVDSYPMSL